MSGNESQSSNCKIVIVDLDGTLANCGHRQHYVQGEGKKNWKAFFHGMYDDTVNTNLNELLQTLHQHYDVYFVSARPDNYQKTTESWLYEKANWPRESYTLYMRKAGDYRADTIVKSEILNKIREDGKEILVVFDDRKSVVDMWRENGIFTCQVADHDF